MAQEALRKLVVYYSLEGNTRFVAEIIASAIGADTLELKPKKDISAKSSAKYLWGGSQVIMKTRPPLLPFHVAPANYDILFIGTPVWSWNYAPALRTFFSTVKLSGKKVALFCCHSGDQGRTLENMRKALAENEILGETDFRDPLQEKEPAAAKAEAWALGIVASLT